ncbi:MAG: outer membrane protein assembly factor BamD [Pseudomonadota bacterium]
MDKIFVISLLVFSLAFMSACSSPGNEEELSTLDTPTTKSAEALYEEAMREMGDENYVQAILLFEKIEQEYPYSKFSTKGQLQAAYAGYLDDKYDYAIVSLDRFIELHPGNEEIDYAHYLKALTYYEQISDVARDQEITKQALDAFETLIIRFPESEYTRDAKLKKDLTLDHLAGKEMNIGRYYLKRNQINAAINRFQTVVKDYQTTTHVAEALHRLVESYLTLGLKEEALKVAAVLGYNYPGSKWYQDTYKVLDAKSRQKIIENQSLWNKTVDSLFNNDE